MSADRQVFFARIRNTACKGHLAQEQVDGAETLLSLFEAHDWPLAWAAYGFATAFWETDFTLQPIAEKGGTAYLTRMYDVTGNRPTLARRMGNTRPGDGVRFCGRGYVQLTWYANYKKAKFATGVDLLANPARAMEPVLAGRIMISGMTEGWFTGKRMADYLNTRAPDYINARRIINGTDKAAPIAALAHQFEAALRAAGYGTAAPPAANRPTPPSNPQPKAEPPAPAPAPPVAQSKPQGFFARFLAALARRTS